MDLSELSGLIETDRAAAAKALDAALHKHHATGAPKVMHRLHRLAATFWQDDPRQVSFHRTHAYVYALEAGMWAEVDALYADLSAEGRI